MNSEPDPTAKFLVGFIANIVRIFLTPFYYAARTDMGVQWAAFVPIIIPAIAYAALSVAVAKIWQVSAPVLTLFGVLVILGFVRNTLQAWDRRRRRDWSVHSWSAGRPLLESVLFVAGLRALRAFGRRSWVRRATVLVLKDDFLYYVAEPVMLVLLAAALWSIGFAVWFYPVFLAAALIVERCDQKLWLYLKAHEVMDAKKLEDAVKGQLENPVAKGGIGIPIAEIPLSPASRQPTDQKSVFDRLSPELQLLLSRDRATQP